MKPGRNEACPCGSGKKYKNCCAGKEPRGVRKPVDQLESQLKSALETADHWRAFTLSLGLVEADPNHPLATKVCGIGYLTQGNAREALKFLQKAATLSPHDPTAHSNLGLAYHRLGKLPEAQRCFRRALQLDPKLADAHNNLALVLQAGGQHEAAIAEYRAAIDLDPNQALFHHNLGSMYSVKSQLDQAEMSFKAALACDPNHIPSLVNMGALCMTQKRWEQARAWLLKAHKLDPPNVNILNNLSGAFIQLRDFSGAADWARKAIDIDGNAPAYANLAIALEELGKTDEAIEAYKVIVARQPSSGDARANLVRAMLAARQHSELYSYVVETEDRDRFAETPQLIPDFVDLFQKHCDFERLRSIWPRFQSVLRSGLELGALRDSLLVLNYDDSTPEEEIYSHHLQWGRQIVSDKPRPASLNVALSKRAPRTRLRVGYLSADFRNHSVGYFVRNLLAHHDKERYEIFCYANLRESDELTDSIARHADNFVKVRDVSDEQLADRIRRDEIDVLIDLSGHTKGTRTQILAWRLAPTQIMYLGYANTSGAPFLDYWITDRYAHAEEDVFHSERLLKMPESFICFGTFEERARRETTPAIKTGHIRFASFNNLAKLSQGTVRLWAQILKRVPNSTLRFKAVELAHVQTRSNLCAEFAKHDIDSARLEFLEYLSDRCAHLDSYNEIDIALDPFPYSGTTTSCEALWMGVPVLTLVGPFHRSRVSYSILKNCGIEDTVAYTQQQYVETAVELARHPNRLTELRGRAARAIRSSVLCDPIRFTRQFEQVLQNASEEARRR